MSVWWIGMVPLPAMLVISTLSDLIERYSVNEDQYGCAIERRRAVQWGRHVGRWYFWIELPSWAYIMDVRVAELRWHRRVLVWRARSVDVPGGWKLWYVPEEPARG